MSATVFANGRSIACKVASGKSAGAMPDVCLSPPSPPTGPIPIPYPNTASASDTDKGSKTVQIGGEEVMLKDSSEFKTSTGNEAATRNFGMGVVTHKIQGVATFISWSMDVKFEDENVPRHMDMMGHNEACNGPSETPPFPYLDTPAIVAIADCNENRQTAKTACSTSIPPENCTEDCKTAQKCILAPKGIDKKYCCANDTTGHHLIEDHWVKGNDNFPMAQGHSGYDAAPTVCANQFRIPGTLHRSLHDVQGSYEESFKPNGPRHVPGAPNGGWNYQEGKRAAIAAHTDSCKTSKCSPKCIEAQLDAFYGADGSRPLNEPKTQALGEARPIMAERFPADGAAD